MGLNLWGRLSFGQLASMLTGSPPHLRSSKWIGETGYPAHCVIKVYNCLLIQGYNNKFEFYLKVFLL